MFVSASCDSERGAEASRSGDVSPVTCFENDDRGKGHLTTHGQEQEMAKEGQDASRGEVWSAVPLS